MSDWLHTVDDVVLCVDRHLVERPRAAAVVVHGFCASRDEANVVAVAEALAALDVDVYRYDARGHGQSGGTCTLGDDERHDVAAVVAEARRRTDRVVLVGASMGGVAALRYAAEDPELAGVVTVSSPAWLRLSSAEAAFIAGMTHTRPGRWLTGRWWRVRMARTMRHSEAPAAVVRRITAPLAAIHGTADRFIPPASARPLADGAAGPSRHVLVPGMGHAFQAAAHGPILRAVEWALATGA